LGDAGAVKEEVDAAEGLLGSGHGLGDGVLIGDVEGEHQHVLGARAGGLEGLEAFSSASREHELHAFGGQRFGDRLADA
jgi:hypothetical protein